MELDISDVFGVNEKIVLSSIERPALEMDFTRAIREGKHVVIYGASKQGKSYLRKKCLQENDYVLIDCAPATTIRDIYISIARLQNVEIVTSRTYGTMHGTSVKARLKVGLKIPLFTSGEAEGEGGKESKQDSSEEVTPLEFNLSNAQHLCELLNRFGLHKKIVLENFHYLKEKAQETLAFDLRTFGDQGFQFIVLGVWKDRNRLTQYNGDLQGRLVEIPVEPWEHSEFDEVCQRGAKALNVIFDPELLEALKAECFNSIGIFQELCKQVCIKAKVLPVRPETITIKDHSALRNAVQAELKNHGQRHLKSFRAFVSRTRVEHNPTPSVAYYVAKAVLKSKFSEIVHGISRDHLMDRISAEFSEGGGPTWGDLGSLLNNILRHQTSRGINPPLFDYDPVDKVLRVIDSTLFFYLSHHKDQVMSDIVEAGGS